MVSKKFLLCSVQAFLLASAAQAVDFNRDVRPILSDKCFFCHGFDEHERKADLRLDTAEGAAEVLASEDGRDSEFLYRILTDDEDDLMPPEDSHKELTSREIDVLRQWIAEGAVYEEPWAYQEPATGNPPPVVNESWPANWVDHHVLARLEAEQRRPSPDADPVTLVRRLHFDLTGLPPEPGRIDAFVAEVEKSGVQGAVEELVDELLASPHFGERMAIYWLDLVRFADTVGYHGDQVHNVSPYRDYVIESFNTNLPFDQFTREQLAGDLLPEATLPQKVASGYNRLLQTSHEDGIQPKEYNAIYAADRVRNVSAVWMAATVGCAQCHDHKYDPYSIVDHYSLAAFFADIHDEGFSGDRNPTHRPPEIQVPDGRTTMITVAQEPREMRVLARGDWLDESGEVVSPAVPAFLPQIVNAGARATRLDLANWLCDPADGVGGLTARVMTNRFWYLYFGTGISRSLSDFGGQGEAPANGPLLDALAVEFSSSGWDVKALVRLLVTSRSYRQSSLATPEMMERDPHNQLVDRQSRYRLPAEIVRDTVLATSGLLVRDVGGQSFRPYQPAGYYRHLNFPKRVYQSDGGDDQWRRGLYIHWQRQFLHPMLKSLDAPSREECAADRPRSNTPNAALTLLNDPTFIQAAQAFAERILAEGGKTDAERLDFAYRETLGRVPDETEKKIVGQLFSNTKAEFSADPQSARDFLSSGQTPSDEGGEGAVSGEGAESGDPIVLATWATVARALFNLGETITRN